MQINHFLVPAMFDQQAVQDITRALNALTGVERIVVYLAEQTVRVEHSDRVSIATLMHAIQSAGYAEVGVLM